MRFRWSLPFAFSLLLACGSAGPAAGAPTSAPTSAPTARPLATAGPPTSTATSLPLRSSAPAGSSAPIPTLSPPNPFSTPPVPTTPAPAPSTAVAGGSGAPVVRRPLVLGYYVPYDTTSWASFQANASHLDFLATQTVTVDACGGIGTRDDQDLKDLAHTQGVRVLPSLLTSSGWLNHQLLADDGAAANAASEIVGYVLAEGYDGFDLDLEGVYADDRDLLSAFVARVADGLHANGKLLTLAIPAKDRDVTTGWAGPYDYAALGQAADLVTVMTYEYHGPFSAPGSIAPYDWVSRVAAFATSQMPPEKVLLGVAFYGYDWNLTSGGARTLGYAQAAELSSRYGVGIGFDPATQTETFGFQAPAGDPAPAWPRPPRPQHLVTQRTPDSCPVEPPPPRPSPTPRPVPPPDTVEDHEVWFEGDGSAQARLGLAAQDHLGGVATWRLGLEDPGVWSLFDAFRSAAIQ